MSTDWNPDRDRDGLFLSQYGEEKQEIPWGSNPMSLINSKPIILNNGQRPTNSLSYYRGSTSGSMNHNHGYYGGRVYDQNRLVSRSNVNDDWNSDVQLGIDAESVRRRELEGKRRAYADNTVNYRNGNAQQNVQDEVRYNQQQQQNEARYRQQQQQQQDELRYRQQQQQQNEVRYRQQQQHQNELRQRQQQQDELRYRQQQQQQHPQRQSYLYTNQPNDDNVFNRDVTRDRQRDQRIYDRRNANIINGDYDYFSDDIHTFESGGADTVHNIVSGISNTVQNVAHDVSQGVSSVAHEVRNVNNAINDVAGKVVDEISTKIAHGPNATTLPQYQHKIYRDHQGNIYSFHDNGNSQYFDPRQQRYESMQRDRFDDVLNQSDALQQQRRADGIELLSKLLPDLSPLELEQEGDIVASLASPNVSGNSLNINPRLQPVDPILDHDALIPSLFEENRDEYEQHERRYRHNQPILNVYTPVLASRYEPNNDNMMSKKKKEEEDTGGFSLFGFKLFGGRKDKQAPSQSTVDITPSWSTSQQHANKPKANIQHHWWFGPSDNDNTERVNDGDSNVASQQPASTLFAPRNQAPSSLPSNVQQLPINDPTIRTENRSLFFNNNNDNAPNNQDQENFSHREHVHGKYDPVGSSNVDLPNYYRKPISKNASNLIANASRESTDVPFHGHQTKPQSEAFDATQPLWWHQRDPAYPHEPDKNFFLATTSLDQQRKETLLPRVNPKTGKLETRDDVAVRQLLEQNPPLMIAQPPPAIPAPIADSMYAPPKKVVEEMKKSKEPAPAKTATIAPPASGQNEMSKRQHPSRYLEWSHNIDNRGGPIVQPTVHMGPYLKPSKNSTNTVHQVTINEKHPRHDDIVQDAVDHTTPMPKIKK